MKNFLSKITKDGALITAMCACIILITAAALITMYNRNRQSSDDGILSENQTEEETSAVEIKEAVVETEEESEEESKNLTLKIETEAELAKATEKNETDNTENTENIDTEANATDEASANDADSEQANAQANDTVDAAETIDTGEVTETVNASAAEASEDTAAQPEAAESIADEANADTYTVDLSLNFTDESKLVWPVSGEVIREFSMDTTVWFSTLKQYRTSDAIQIQSDAGTEVVAAATGQVTAVGEDDELGYFVEMDLGNGYRATYAQLSDIIVEPGNYVTAGTSFACVAEPTYYYVVDGAHLYFKLTHDDELLDPLDYLE